MKITHRVAPDFLHDRLSRSSIARYSSANNRRRSAKAALARSNSGISSDDLLASLDNPVSDAGSPTDRVVLRPAAENLQDPLILARPITDPARFARSGQVRPNSTRELAFS